MFEAGQDGLKEAAKRALQRFPLALAFAWSAGAVALLRSFNRFEVDDASQLQWCLALGIPVAMGLHYQTWQVPRQRLWSWALLGSAFILVCLWLIGQSQEHFFLRYALLSAGLHLSVGLAPFVRRPDDRRFWAFNHALFVNFASTWFFGVVLFGGLALLLFLLEKLFGVEMPSQAYDRLWLGVMFFFQPLHFCSKAPDPERPVQESPGAFLSYFAKYILQPLVLIHGVGLIVYALTLLVRQQWPKPEAILLCSLHASVGLLTAALVWPKVREKGTWAYTYARGYHWATLAVMGLLLSALWHKRVTEGLAPDTQGLALAGLVAAGLSVAYLRWPRLSLRWVPGSALVLGLLLAAGPFGALESAVRYQEANLRQVLIDQGMLGPQGWQRIQKELPFEARREWTARIELTYEVLGQEGFARVAGYAVPENAQDFLNARGVKPVHSWETEDMSKGKNLPSVILTPENIRLRPLFGSAYLVEPPEKKFCGCKNPFVPGPRTVSYGLDEREQVLRLFIGDQEVYKLPLAASTQRLLKLKDASAEPRQDWSEDQSRRWEDLVLARRLPRGLGTLVATVYGIEKSDPPRVTRLDVELLTEKPFDIKGIQAEGSDDAEDSDDLD
jgi:hypothetical protein